MSSEIIQEQQESPYITPNISKQSNAIIISWLKAANQHKAVRPDAPAIAKKQLRAHLTDILETVFLRNYLLYRSLEQIISDYLTAPPKGDLEDQMTLAFDEAKLPEAERKIIRKLGKLRIALPEAGVLVELVTSSSEELSQAAAAIEKFADGCLKTVTDLKRLARVRRQRRA
jgi:hypothetical protein